MRYSRLSVFGLCGLLLVLTVTLADSGNKDRVEWRTLFDGKTLTGWKPSDFGGEEGKVHVKDGAIVMPRGKKMTGITYTKGDFPKLNYELTLQARRTEGNDFFATTTFPVGDSFCSFVVAGWSGSVVGLSTVDSEDASVNETSKSMEFKNDQWYRLRIRVTARRIEAWIDDKKMVDLDTTDRRIGIRLECRPCRPLGVATWDSTGEVRDIRVRNLSEAEIRAAVPKAAESDEGILPITLRSREKVAGKSFYRVQEKSVQWAASKTAIIVCDMWDDHWCRSAARRVVELTGPMNEMLHAARKKGVFIIHAPSTCTNFYKDTPQRQRAIQAPFVKTPVPLATSERWGTAWCWPDGKREGVLPIDDSDMGCDCKEKCTIRAPWKRQIAGIDIGPDDAITDNGQETWNLLQQRGIDNVILCGVHLNMCVLGRPFGIRQMVRLGKNVALMRDMTDTMYNPERPPGVSHFAGTDLMVQHVEKFWCPSLTSSVFTGKPAFRFKGAEGTNDKTAP